MRRRSRRDAEHRSRGVRQIRDVRQGPLPVRRVRRIQCALGAWVAGRRRGIVRGGRPFLGCVAGSRLEVLTVVGDRKSACRAGCLHLPQGAGRCLPPRVALCTRGVGLFAALPHAAARPLAVLAQESFPELAPPVPEAQPDRYRALPMFPSLSLRSLPVAQLALRRPVLMAERWALLPRAFRVQGMQPEPLLRVRQPCARRASPVPARQAWGALVPLSGPPEALQLPWAEQP